MRQVAPQETEGYQVPSTKTALSVSSPHTRSPQSVSDSPHLSAECGPGKYKTHHRLGSTAPVPVDDHDAEYAVEVGVRSYSE